MKRGIAMLLAFLLALSFAAAAESPASTEEWMVGETIELAKRIQELGADEAYGRMYSSDEQILSVGGTAAQMTIPDASKATVIYVDMNSFLMSAAGTAVTLSDEAAHAMNMQFGSILLQMTGSAYGVYATAGMSVYHAEEVYPGFDAFANAVVLLDCGTATIGAAFSMTDNGIVAATAKLLPAGAMNAYLAINMPSVQTESRTIQAAEGDEWYKTAALNAAARLKLLMSDAMYVEGMGASDEIKAVLDGYAAGEDAGMECVREIIPSKDILPNMSFENETQKRFMAENMASQVPTMLLARKGVTELSAGSMVNATLYYSGFSDFESRVVFVDAKTFTAGVSFTNMGKGVVCARAIPMPADILKDFSETDIPNMPGMAG